MILKNELGLLNLQISIACRIFKERYLTKFHAVYMGNLGQKIVRDQ